MKSGELFKQFLKAAGITAMILTLTACHSGFGFKTIEPEMDFAQSLAQGQTLFKTHCSSCHADASYFTNRNLSPDAMEELITFAITKVPAMGALRGQLSSSDFRSIAEALSNQRPPTSNVCSNDPGRVPSHRLNRREYENTVRDLTGVQTLNVAGRFPEDPVILSFDNNASSLTLTPTTAEAYLQVAEEISAELFLKNRSRVVSCTPTSTTAAACARTSVTQFGKLAFRRPLSTAEVDQLMKIFTAVRALSPNQGVVESFDEGMKAAVTAMLISPQFLYRTVVTANNKNPQAIDSLDAYELATRLSYFLWSTMPDATLMQLADSGQLLQDAVLDEQINRMLRDPKARALVSGFGTYWVHLNQLKNSTPSTTVYPLFSESMRASMQKETELFIEEVLLRDRSLYDFVEADYSFVDQRLAGLYGLNGVTSTTHQRVSLAGTGRQGILTQASILTLTANPSESNIVRRGMYVLENILCSAPPSPPPGVDVTLPPLMGTQTPRERMEAHRRQPTCASCHNVMDPLGFSLENYDGIGQFRSQYSNQLPVDASGQLPDGSTFTNATEMIQIIRQSPSYPTCASEKLLTYALGRGLSAEEKCTVEKMGQMVVRRDTKFSDLVKAVVKSDHFRKQKGDQP